MSLTTTHATAMPRPVVPDPYYTLFLYIFAIEFEFFTRSQMSLSMFFCLLYITLTLFIFYRNHTNIDLAEIEENLNHEQTLRQEIRKYVQLTTSP